MKVTETELRELTKKMYEALEFIYNNASLRPDEVIRVGAAMKAYNDKNLQP